MNGAFYVYIHSVYIIPILFGSFLVCHPTKKVGMPYFHPNGRDSLETNTYLWNMVQLLVMQQIQRGTSPSPFCFCIRVALRRE